MKNLEIEGIELKDSYHVRINIGDHMYFDSPMTTKKNAHAIFDNLDARLHTTKDGESLRHGAESPYNITKEYPMEVGYEGDNPNEDWWIKIEIPKQKDWYDTQAIAKEVKKAYEARLK